METSETKVCERCGREFFCGALSGNCRCFEIQLSAETLSDLRRSFSSCLCFDCLTEFSRPREETVYEQRETT
ncbi:MAG: cysteine-rich CWC family protein [Acidobacteria bacterium]|nr:cysteine-rich CWC family protein [Acidobacteriota bacterium]MBK8149005.1 cysteine-rich CWC family protein [Acidobacteriota bacterium]MBK8811637.1 cysteine-rich CWC family protein [Acidobacteriota bacterium]